MFELEWKLIESRSWVVLAIILGLSIFMFMILALLNSIDKMLARQVQALEYIANKNFLLGQEQKEYFEFVKSSLSEQTGILKDILRNRANLL